LVKMFVAEVYVEATVEAKILAVGAKPRPKYLPRDCYRLTLLNTRSIPEKKNYNITIY